MKDWREALREIQAPSAPGGPTRRIREEITSAVKEFADELKSLGHLVEVELREEEIGISVRTHEALVFEGVIEFREFVVFTVLSSETIISNFRFFPQLIPDKGEVLKLLVLLFASAQRLPRQTALAVK
jgi:hypothetical protein